MDDDSVTGYLDSIRKKSNSWKQPEQ
jgi:hypothetical protein